MAAVATTAVFFVQHCVLCCNESLRAALTAMYCMAKCVQLAKFTQQCVSYSTRSRMALVCAVTMLAVLH